MAKVHFARNIWNAEIDHEDGPLLSYLISPGSGWIMSAIL
jgi:hypothetical protein